MAKTKQIGVRFDEELLTDIKKAGLADSPQKALNLYERSYLELIRLKVEINNRPENKQRIENERNPSTASNKPQGGSNVQNLNKPTGAKEVPVNEPKTNETIDTTGKPTKLPNESGIDYAIRIEEWKKSQQK